MGAALHIHLLNTGRTIEKCAFHTDAISSSSADGENAQGLILLRNGAQDLVRNNKYAAAGVRQIVANMIGDGIAVQLRHDDAVVQRTAQDDWDRWAEGNESKVANCRAGDLGIIGVIVELI